MTRVCKDTDGRVVDDVQCEQGSASGAHARPVWWYMPYLRGGYPVGNQLSGGSAFAPAGARIDPNPGLRRGGFGESAQGSTGA